MGGLTTWDPEVQERLEGEFLLVNLEEGFVQNRPVEDQLELDHPNEQEVRPKMGRRQVAVRLAMNHWEIWERHHPVLYQSLEQKGCSALASPLPPEYPEAAYFLLEGSVGSWLKLIH
jgi:hypothetical protein